LWVGILKLKFAVSAKKTCLLLISEEKVKEVTGILDMSAEIALGRILKMYHELKRMLLPRRLTTSVLSAREPQIN
jgi:hypothetical protein